MNTIITIKFQLADILAALPGIMIFISVLLAGSEKWRKRQWAWILGLVTQLVLILFGWLTGHFGFATNILAAAAFAWNLWKSTEIGAGPPKRNIEKEFSDEARHRMQSALSTVDEPTTLFARGGVIKGDHPSQ